MLDLANQIGEKLLMINFAFTLLYCVKEIFNAFGSSMTVLLEGEQWRYLVGVLWTMSIGLPQSLQLGLMIGLWFLKVKVYLSSRIWVDYCEDMTKMASVNLIAFDKKF